MKKLSCKEITQGLFPYMSVSILRPQGRTVFARPDVFLIV